MQTHKPQVLQVLSAQSPPRTALKKIHHYLCLALWESFQKLLLEPSWDPQCDEHCRKWPPVAAAHFLFSCSLPAPCGTAAHATELFVQFRSMQIFWSFIEGDSALSWRLSVFLRKLPLSLCPTSGVQVQQIWFQPFRIADGHKNDSLGELGLLRMERRELQGDL